MKKVILKPGREKSIHRRHLWVFSGAILRVPDKVVPGETVKIVSQQDEIPALGSYSPQPQIRLRIWTFDPNEEIGGNFFKRYIERAVLMRKCIIGNNLGSLRLVNAESDGIPGLVVDKYDDFLVCQFLSAGAEFYKHEILEQLEVLLGPAGIYERSDTDSRQKEGLSSHFGLLYGSEPPETIMIEQNNIKLPVDVRRGHKTGMYLDQRENRNIIKQFAKDRDVLNCFAYTRAL